ncbi:hypothetical protein KF840_08275 [bacterium]|nr:hypothetical protein [bacterium]
MSRPRLFVWRGALPLWFLLVAGLPLAAMFLFSLAIAGAVVLGGALLASLLLPRLGGRRAPRRDDGTIELDPSQFRRLPESRQRR